MQHADALHRGLGAGEFDGQESVNTQVAEILKSNYMRRGVDQTYYGTHG